MPDETQAALANSTVQEGEGRDSPQTGVRAGRSLAGRSISSSGKHFERTALYDCKNIYDTTTRLCTLQLLLTSTFAPLLSWFHKTLSLSGPSGIMGEGKG